MENLAMPDGLPAGFYLITATTAFGQTTVKICK